MRQPIVLFMCTLAIIAATAPPKSRNYYDVRLDRRCDRVDVCALWVNVIHSNPVPIAQWCAEHNAVLIDTRYEADGELRGTFEGVAP